MMLKINKIPHSRFFPQITFQPITGVEANVNNKHVLIGGKLNKPYAFTNCFPLLYYLARK